MHCGDNRIEEWAHTPVLLKRPPSTRAATAIANESDSPKSRVDRAVKTMPTISTGCTKSRMSGARLLGAARRIRKESDDHDR